MAGARTHFGRGLTRGRDGENETRAANEIIHNLPDYGRPGTFICEPAQNGNMQALFDNRGHVIPAKMGPYDEVVKDYGLKKE